MKDLGFQMVSGLQKPFVFELPCFSSIIRFDGALLIS